MKKILVAAALVGTGVSAQAADLAVKAPVYKAPVIAAYNWTGFYLGVNAGLGFGRSYTQLSNSIAGVGADSQNRLGGLGALGGAQIGYNWQVGNLFGINNVVFGLEADIQGTSFRDDRTCAVECVGAFGVAYDQKLGWFGTVRGRVGLANGPVLSYLTGGFAYGGVKTTVTDFAAPALATTFSNTRSGWTIGSGVEAALGGNWTGKLEYLYLDLGTQTGTALAPNPYVYASEIREHIFRAGLNYRIGGTGLYAPVPVANWAGWFVGGNFGGGTALNRSSLVNSPTPPLLANEQFNLMPDGWLGGGQIGYNWQAANWVYGLEADIQGTTLKDDKTCALVCSTAVTFAAFDQKMQWFGTVRGRVGYSIGSTLFYATGGFAYGGVKTHVAGLFGLPFDQTFSRTRTGYTVGAGIESPFELFGLLGKNWTAKTEYLFVDLGHADDFVTVAGATGFAFSTKVQEHIMRTGISYHFNSPVVARY